MRKDIVLITGNKDFSTSIQGKLSGREDVMILPTGIDLDTERRLNGEIDQLRDKVQDATIIFSSAEPFLMPVLEMSLRQAKNVVVFGVHKHKTMELECLLDLSLESGSHILNGDALFYNPVVYSNLQYFQSGKIVKLSSNRFNQFLSRRSIFSCIELLLWKIKSPVKKIDAKAVQLNLQRLNLIHVRIEFENDVIAILEMSNTKVNSALEVESVGSEAWLSLDLLTLNGTIHKLSDDTGGEVKIQTEKIYPSHRYPINNLLTYINQELLFETNPQAQFENAILTSRVLSKVEDQLSRSFPHFTSFDI